MESAQQDVSRRSRSAAVSLKPALLGAGVLFSVLLNTLRFFPEDEYELAFSLRPFTVFTGWGLLGCGIVLVVLAVAAKRSGRALPDPAGTVPLLSGACLTAIGLQFALPLYGRLTLPYVEPILFGLSLGVGMTMLATAWGSVFARLEPENLLFNSALSIMLAAALHFIAEPLSPSPLGIALIACSLIASVALLLVARTLDKPAAQQAVENEPDDDAGHRSRQRKALAILWMPLVGACVACFIFGLTWDSGIPNEHTRLHGPLGAWKSLIGPSLLTVIVATIVLRKAGSSPLRLLYRVACPIAVAMLLALPVINADSNLVAAVIDVLTQASFAVIALAIWCSMASAARSAPLAAMLIFPACLVPLALAFVIGLCGIAIIGTDGHAIRLIMLTVYLALIAISFARASRSREGRRTGPCMPDDSRTSIRHCCDSLAVERGLSPREREVLYYLGRGYNHGYVADRLSISESTVRTHVRGIYGKLSVDSREELLALINAVEEKKERTVSAS